MVSLAAGLDLLLARRGRALLPVASGSLAPLVEAGDRIEAAPWRGAPAAGDLALIERGGEIVVHRLLARQGAGWLARGEARGCAEEYYPRQALLARARAAWRGGRRLELCGGALGAAGGLAAWALPLERRCPGCGRLRRLFFALLARLARRGAEAPR